MAKPQGKVKIEWSPDFAYAIGLIVTDGNLSPDGRHLSFTSKDLELIELFQKCLEIRIHIGRKKSGFKNKIPYYVTQFGDVQFYRFLESIGLMPNKSKKLQRVLVPDEYFRDYVRGLFDGDGTFYSYMDSRWKSSYMFYTAFASASAPFIRLLKASIRRQFGVDGHISISTRDGMHQLRFAKKATRILVKALYYSPDCPSLSRKRLKILKALSILPTP